MQRQPSGKRELRCTERYDTMRRGWNDFIGCYQDAAAPPPDVWFVFRSRTKSPEYIAMDSDTSGKSGKIDLIQKGLDAEWKITELYVDSDCNGTVDLIMYQVSGNDASSRLPPANLRMTSLAKELDTALKKGRIPYSKLRVCQ